MGKITISTEDAIALISDKVQAIKQENKPVIIAIDGCSCSGKTTLADSIHNALVCNLFHMDDFFLRPKQRTEARFSEPGGNVDRERFLDEVLSKIKVNKPFSYHPFDCDTMGLKAPVEVNPCDINIVEGAYCMHPLLQNYYDFKIFVTVDKDVQFERVKKRNPDRADMFINKWIPLEDKYFKAFDIENKCDVVISLEG